MKNVVVGMLLTVGLWGGLLPAMGQTNTRTSATGSVTVIPISGVIERALVYVIRRGVSEAVQQGKDAIVFTVDTPGGRLDSAKEIVNIIADVDIPTYALVAPDAISAGAIISLATDKIYMTPGSRIGDAMPIMMGPGGGVQEVSKDHTEKIRSYTAAMIRSVAQRNGHDDQLAEAMVRPELEYKIGETVISKEGELVTLTNVEAEQMVGDGDARRRLLSEGTVDSLEDLLATIGLAEASIERFEVSPMERMARVIEMFSFLLLAGGILGIWIEIKTPGFGIPGITGAILLFIWFWGHNIAGLAGMGEVFLFVMGVFLLVLEIFVIPGFGLAGLAGMGLMLAGLVLAMVEHYPGTPSFEIPLIQFEGVVYNLGLALLVAFIMGLFLLRVLPSTPAYSHLVLASETRVENGYRSSEDRQAWVGMHGEAVTALRPGGIGLIDGKRVSVISRGPFIEKGQPISVTEVHGARIVVDEVKA